MKIKELIELLKNYDPELEVIYPYEDVYDKGYFEIDTFQIKRLDGNLEEVNDFSDTNLIKLNSELLIYRDQLNISKNKRKAMREKLSNLFLQELDPTDFDIQEWKAVETEYKNINDNINKLNEKIANSKAKDYLVIS